MKHILPRSGIAAFLPLFVFAVITRAQNTPPPTPASGNSGEEEVKLPEFTVSTSAADPYHPEDAISGARVAGALLDTPISINVVPKELLQDLGANATYEAARYMPGISNGRGT